MLKQLEPLIHKSVVRKFSSGSTILYQGEVPRSASILTQGVVRVFSISAQGDEQIVMYHIAGEFFPSSWIFEHTPSTLFFYEALTDCEVAFVPRSEFVTFMLENPERTRALLDYFTKNFAASMVRVNALEQPKARDKLTYTLYFLCQRYGKMQSPKVHIPLTLTHQNLAGLVGLTRETTATEMNKLKKEGVLNYDNQKYIVDTEKLLDLIGEDSFRNMSLQ